VTLWSHVNRRLEVFAHLLVQSAGSCGGELERKADFGLDVGDSTDEVRALALGTPGSEGLVSSLVGRSGPAGRLIGEQGSCYDEHYTHHLHDGRSEPDLDSPHRNLPVVLVHYVFLAIPIENVIGYQDS
jgi:hypothetical protein